MRHAQPHAARAVLGLGAAVEVGHHLRAAGQRLGRRRAAGVGVLRLAAQREIDLVGRQAGLRGPSARRASPRPGPVPRDLSSRSSAAEPQAFVRPSFSAAAAPVQPRHGLTARRRQPQQAAQRQRPMHGVVGCSTSLHKSSRASASGQSASARTAASCVASRWRTAASASEPPVSARVRSTAAWAASGSPLRRSIATRGATRAGAGSTRRPTAATALSSNGFCTLAEQLDQLRIRLPRRRVSPAPSTRPTATAASASRAAVNNDGHRRRRATAAPRR